VRKRLLEFLIYLASKNNAQADPLILENFLTHADIAGLIGSTRQTVTTLINELEEEGIIEFSRKEIVIRSLGSLKKLAL
jgi:CRP/FNR family transcriptional regulator